MIALVVLWVSTALVLFALWAIARHDWVRLTRPSVKVRGRVVGHEAVQDDGNTCYSARIAFDVAGKPMEVLDQSRTLQTQPDVGTDVLLRYPDGRPDLARIPRSKTWIAIYAMLIATLAFLVIDLANA